MSASLLLATRLGRILPALQNFLSADHLFVVTHMLQPCHDDSDSTVIKLWPPSATKHLHDLKVRVLFAASRCIVLIRYCVLDDDHVAG